MYAATTPSTHRDEHRLEQGIPSTEHEREPDQEALPGQLEAVGGGDAIERRAVPVCQVPGDLDVVVVSSTVKLRTMAAAPR